MKKFEKLNNINNEAPKLLDAEFEENVTGGCVLSCPDSCGDTCSVTCSSTGPSLNPF